MGRLWYEGVHLEQVLDGAGLGVLVVSPRDVACLWLDTSRDIKGADSQNTEPVRDSTRLASREAVMINPFPASWRQLESIVQASSLKPRYVVFDGRKKVVASSAARLTLFPPSTHVFPPCNPNPG